ncbi:MAG: ABC transporter permease, partial [Desulfovermiculus sp.]|nr:ABC transporter permease [Desulfovermiculus sp.]
SFWFGLILIIILGVKLGLLPISGSDSWQNFIMPAIALGYYATPAFMRLTRSGMLEVLGSDYIRTARAKGLSHRQVIFKHALRNAIIPVVSLVAVQLGFMLGGSVVIETVFAINGFGFLAYDSITRADLPMVQAVVLILSLIYVVLTFLSDLLNAFLDPRIRVK